MATKKRWSAKVDTESTDHEAGLFKKGARTIAKSLASPEVFPKGPASGAHAELLLDILPVPKGRGFLRRSRSSSVSHFGGFLRRRP
jgi:hypothetical protein